MAKIWAREEISYLQENFPICEDLNNVAEKLGRSLDSVKSKAYKLGLKRETVNLWSSSEDQTLADMYKQFSVQEIAKVLDRTPRAIQHRISHLKLYNNIPKKVVSKNGVLNFYLIKCIDIDLTPFYKIGWTSKKNISSRFNGRKYEVLLVYTSDRETIKAFETELKKTVISRYKYKPLDKAFYQESHGGYTECFKPVEEPIFILDYCMDNILKINNG